VDGRFFADLRHPVTFYLFRHGLSEGNAAGLFQGRLDLPLASVGRDQARRRGETLRGLRDAVVTASPLSRAKETATIISETAELGEVRVLEALVEMNTGRLTGRSWNDFFATEPEASARFQAESWDSVDGAEGAAALYERGLTAWRSLADLARDSEANAVIAVTHAGMLQWLVKTTLGCPSWFPLIGVGNCSTFRFSVKPSKGGSILLSWEELGTPLA